MIRFLLSTAVALKLALFASFAAVLFTAPAHAQAADETCNGENLIERVARDFPDALTRIEREADAMANGTGRFWRVSKPGVAPSHLFGTMHVTDPRVTTLPDAVEKALDDADVLAVEIAEIGDDAAMQAAATAGLKHMVYLDGTTLADRLDDSEEATIQEALADMPQMPWAVAQRMKPWVVMGALAVPGCEAARKAGGLKVLDATLVQRASARDIRVVGLESVVGQMAVLDTLPEEAMLTALKDYARLDGVLNDVFETTIALYEQGKVAMIWALLRDPVMQEFAVGSGDAAESEQSAAAFQRIAVDARNATMLEGTLPLVEAGNAFVAVGALHMPGETGLVAALERAGWSVEALD